MIKICNVDFYYGKTKVLEDINLSIPNGSFVGLIGTNGAGKTTLLKLMMGLLKPIDGKIEDDFKKKSYLSQVTSNNDLSFPAKVKEVVSLGLKNKPFSFMGRKDWEKVDEALKIMNVFDLKNRSMNELSGGQQQRVRLSQALISNPDFLVLDEPTAGMDKGSRELFLNELKDLNQRLNMTILIVTHYIDDLKASDMIYELNNNTISLYRNKEVSE